MAQDCPFSELVNPPKQPPGSSAGVSVQVWELELELALLGLIPVV